MVSMQGGHQPGNMENMEVRKFESGQGKVSEFDADCKVATVSMPHL